MPARIQGRKMTGSRSSFVVFVVVLLTGEQLVRIIDIIEIQVQGRCRWMLEIGGILPLLAVDRVVVGSVANHSGILHRRGACPPETL